MSNSDHPHKSEWNKKMGMAYDEHQKRLADASRARVEALAEYTEALKEAANSVNRSFADTIAAANAAYNESSEKSYETFNRERGYGK